MDEFAALAQRVVLTLDDVRGCLVLSRDGLVLGAFPEDQEAELKPAWLRFVHVGEARKGFVEFSDQLWAFVHRGPYAAFVVTGTSVRPGVMLDQLEQAVIAAEEARAKQKEVTLKVPDASSAPSGRPRTSLHPPADRPAAANVTAGQTSEAAAQEMPSFTAPAGMPDESGAEPAWAGADPDAANQMQAMQEQMRAMQQQMQAQMQKQGIQQPIAPSPSGGAAPTPAGPISGYRRPESAAPTSLEPSTPPADSPRPGAELSGVARPSVEGSAYEAVLAEDRSASPLGSESSPFARLEAEQQAAAAEPPSTAAKAAPEAATTPADDAGTFRQEPPRLISSEEPPPPAKEEEEPSEVDRVLLAKEFSGLLQLGEDADED
jgi:hypothetical protein